MIGIYLLILILAAPFSPDDDKDKGAFILIIKFNFNLGAFFPAITALYILGLIAYATCNLLGARLGAVCCCFRDMVHRISTLAEE